MPCKNFNVVLILILLQLLYHCTYIYIYIYNIMKHGREVDWGNIGLRALISTEVHSAEVDIRPKVH